MTTATAKKEDAPGAHEEKKNGKTVEKKPAEKPVIHDHLQGSNYCKQSDDGPCTLSEKDQFLSQLLALLFLTEAQTGAIRFTLAMEQLFTDWGVDVPAWRARAQSTRA